MRWEPPGFARAAPGEAPVGVVAEATVASAPAHKLVQFAKNPERFPWSFKVKDVRYFFNKPVVIDAGLRERLDAFVRFCRLRRRRAAG